MHKTKEKIKLYSILISFTMMYTAIAYLVIKGGDLLIQTVFPPDNSPGVTYDGPCPYSDSESSSQSGDGPTDAEIFGNRLFTLVPLILVLVIIVDEILRKV